MFVVRTLLLLGLVVAAVGCAVEATPVCAGYAGTCLDLTVRSSSALAIDRLDISATGAVTGLRTSMLDKAAALPVHVALQLPMGTSGALQLAVTGRLALVVVGEGSTSVTLVADQQNSAVVELAAAHDPDLAVPAIDLAGGLDLLASQSDLLGSSLPDLVDVPDLASFCVPSTGHACTDAVTLERCNASGTAYETQTCARGCGATPTPHCKLVIPTGAAENSDLTFQGVADKTLTDVTLHSDTGEIEGGVRIASPDPTALTVISGIGFHVVNVGGNNVGIFLFDHLTLVGTVKVVGTHSVALLAKSDVILEDLTVAADQTANTPGPGGYAGGQTGALNGLGPGGGKGGSSYYESSISGYLYSGAGGGGHAASGGAGGPIGTAAAGVGGTAYDSSTLLTLRGGSGGGASSDGSKGGAGGGAVQIVSQTAISISGGIAAGGAGGRFGGGKSGGGGGAGGAILLEAPTVTLANDTYLITGGGGGGGATSNGNGAGNSITEVAVGTGGFCGTRCGGQGAYSATTDGTGAVGKADGQQTGGGGGAAGLVRINTLTGAASLGTGIKLVPPITATNLFSQGVITIQ